MEKQQKRRDSFVFWVKTIIFVVASALICAEVASLRIEVKCIKDALVKKGIELAVIEPKPPSR